MIASCNGTGAGDTGDPHAKPKADELGDGDRVSEVVLPATWIDPGNMDSTGCKEPADAKVRISGQAIVAIDDYDETGSGQKGNIYVEDVVTDGGDPAPFSGLTIFGASFSPPDLRVFPGDVVDTTGVFDEFLGPSSGAFGDCKTLPEMNGTMSFRFEDPAALTPLTIVKAGGDPARYAPIKGYANMRQWLGMLVRIEGVSIPDAPSCSGCDMSDCTKCPADWLGRFGAPIDVGGGIAAADIVSISNELYDVTGEGPAIPAMTQFKAVTGVVTYFYGFHIAPRSPADFEQ